MKTDAFENLFVNGMLSVDIASAKIVTYQLSLRRTALPQFSYQYF